MSILTGNKKKILKVFELHNLTATMAVRMVSPVLPRRQICCVLKKNFEFVKGRTKFPILDEVAKRYKKVSK